MVAVRVTGASQRPQVCVARPEGGEEEGVPATPPPRCAGWHGAGGATGAGLTR